MITFDLWVPERQLNIRHLAILVTHLPVFWLQVGATVIVRVTNHVAKSQTIHVTLSWWLGLAVSEFDCPLVLCVDPKSLDCITLGFNPH